jgi:hypothetical protein
VRRKIDRDFELARLGIVDCLRARASARAAVSLSNQQDYEIEAFPRILENLAAPFANPAVTRSHRITVKNSRDDAERSSRGKSSRYRVAKENRDKRILRRLLPQRIFADGNAANDHTRYCAATLRGLNGDSRAVARRCASIALFVVSAMEIYENLVYAALTLHLSCSPFFLGFSRATCCDSYDRAIPLSARGTFCNHECLTGRAPPFHFSALH